VIPAPDAVAALAALLEIRRAAFTPPVTMSLAVADHGAWVLDSAAPEITREGWSDDTELGLVTNARTLSEWVAGRFDPSKLEPHHLFLWSGDTERWRLLASVLGSGGSPLDVRASRSRPR
jgi:hypothetical protein